MSKDPYHYIPMDQTLQKQNLPTLITALIERARLAGASDAAAVAADNIAIEDSLADLCREPQCENYGLSLSCPPHVAGPAEFRKWLQNYERALVIKIDVPSAVLLSDERREVMQLLHEIAADVELAAVEQGYPESKAFAGGSCKMIFCRDKPDCRVVDQGGRCRHPKQARPSMSGFGINVAKLMSAAGWDLKRVNQNQEAEQESTATVTALVLLG